MAIKYIISASDLAKIAFCEKMFVIERHYRRIDFKTAMNFMRGRILHFLWRSLRKGTKEKLLTTVIDDVLLVGKPDLFFIQENEAVVEEFKSRVARKVYLSEALQLIAYMKLVKDNFNCSVKGYVNYLNARVKVPFSEKTLMHFIERCKQLIKEEKPRSKCKYKKCRYNALCASLFR